MTDSVATIGIAFPTDGLVQGKAALVDIEVAANKAAEAADRLSAANNHAKDAGSTMAVAMKGVQAVVEGQAAATSGLSDAKKELSSRDKEAAESAEKFLAKLTAQADAFGKTNAEVARMQEAMHGVSEFMEPVISGMKGAAESGESFSLSGALVTRALELVVSGMIQGALQMAELNKQLAITGDAAGITAGQFNDMASNIASSTNSGIGTAKEIILGLVASGRIAGDAFDSVSAAAVRFADRSGVATDKVVEDFSSMADGVTAWAVKHNEQYHFLTAAQYQHIAALEKEGDTSQAMIATMSALNQHMAANQQSIGYLGQAWRYATNTAAAYWDIIKGIGAGQTTDDKATAAVQKAVAAQTAYDAAVKSFGGTGLADDQAMLARLKKAVDDTKASYDTLNTARINETAEAKAKAQSAEEQARAIKAIESTNKLKESLKDKATLDVAQYEKNQAAIRAADPAMVDNAKEHARILKGLHKRSNPGTQSTNKSSAPTRAAGQSNQNEEADAEKKVYDNSLKSLDEYHKQHQISDTQFYVGRKAAQDTYTAQLTANYVASAAQIAAKAPKDGVGLEKARNAEIALAIQYTKDLNAVRKQGQDDYNDMLGTIQSQSSKEIDSLDKAIAAQQLKNSQIGMTKEQIDALKQSQDELKTKEEEVEAATLKAYIAERDYDDDLNGSAKVRLAYLEIEIAKRKQLAQSQADGAVAQANADASKKAGDEWKKTLDSVSKAGEDMFVNWGMNGTDAAKQIGDTLKKALLKAIYEATIQPIVVQVVSSVLGPSGAAGSASSVLNAGSSASSLYTMGSNAYSYISSLFGSSGSGMPALASADSAVLHSNLGYTGTTEGVATESLVSSEVANGGTAATGASSAGMGASSMVPIIGWIIAGMMGSSSAYDMGFRGNSDAHGTTNPINWGLNLEDRTIGNPLGLDPKTSAILSGSSLGSLASYIVFGGQTLTPAGGGLTGTLGNNAASVQARTDTVEDHRGVLGIGSYTTHNSSYSAVDQSTQDMLNGGVKGATDAVKAYATAIGLSADAVNGFTQDINIDLGGLDAAGVQAKITSTFAAFGDAMVTSAYGSTITALQKPGETSSQTLARLAADLTTVNADFKLLGLSMLPVSVDSAKIAAGLVSAAGGLDKLQASFNYYYTHFIPTSVQAANASATLSAQFAALGKTMPTTRQGFVDLVNSIDITTPAGQALEAAILALAPAFDAVAASADQASQQAAQAAAQFSSAYASALQDYGTPDEQRAFSVDQIQQGLAKGGVNLTVDQIANANRNDAVALYRSYDPAQGQTQTAAQHAAQVAILEQAKAFAALTPAMNAATTAMVGSSGGGGGGGASGAASALATALQSLTDNIFKEVQRIRGLIAGPGEVGYEQSQMQFALATAQARAGDQTAMAQLPQMSQTMLTLAAANVGTLRELQIIEAQTAASLQTTGSGIALQNGLPIPTNGLTIPSFDVGTNSVPQDTPALVHQSEKITPAASNNDDERKTRESMVTVLKAIKEDIGRMKQILVNVTPKGVCIEVETVVVP